VRFFLKHEVYESGRPLIEHDFKSFEDNTNVIKGQMQVVKQLECEKGGVE
jgi:hypothetical protein